jgi:hypothetical protein
MTGVMISTWIVDVTMPPMIGAAMGFMMSEPRSCSEGVPEVSPQPIHADGRRAPRRLRDVTDGRE